MKHLINLSFFVAFANAVFAQPGTLDKTFGTEGRVFSESFTAVCHALAIQPDGKIVAAGTGTYDELLGGYFVARYNSDGSLDNTFGNEGRVVTEDFGIRTGRIESIVILPSGKILAAGWVGNYGLIDIVLLQYNPNGSLDSSFGVNGIVITDIAKYDYIYDMAVQTDGKIIVAGNRIKDINHDNLTSFTVRYMPDGSLDKSFGKKGIALTSYSDNIDITSVALQPDGKIIVGGKYKTYGDFMLLRYQQDGSLDSSFGGDGIIGYDFGADIGDLFALAVQPDGKILAAGEKGLRVTNMVIVRFTTTGAVDTSFGGNKGYTSRFFDNGTSHISTVLMQDDGKILVAGYYFHVLSRFALLRLRENGILDSSFGENGITLTTFEDAGSISCNAAVLQADGKVVLGGRSFLNTPPDYYHFVLARYNNVEKVKQPEFAKIQKWQGHYGFTWDDWPGNKTTYYSVGRSTDASMFNEIAQVPDINGKKKYQFEDPAPLNGTVYYRLTAVRSDGKSVTSNIVITWNASAIKLFPNPAKNSLQLQGLSAIEKTKLSIVDLSGNTKTTAIATGSNYTINIAQLKPGNYMLRMETNGEIVTRMFVKE